MSITLHCEVGKNTGICDISIRSCLSTQTRMAGIFYVTPKMTPRQIKEGSNTAKLSPRLKTLMKIKPLPPAAL